MSVIFDLRLPVPYPGVTLGTPKNIPERWILSYINEIFIAFASNAKTLAIAILVFLRLRLTQNSLQLLFYFYSFSSRRLFRTD